MTAFWEWIVDAFSRLRFWAVIQPDEMGVRTFCGRFEKVLPPGVYLVFPVLGEVTVAQVKEQVIDIRAQSLTTADNHSVAIGVSIAYEVMDPMRAFFQVQDWDESLANEALRVVGQFVCNHSYSQCKDAKTLNEALIKDLRVIATNRWGIKILRIGISDLVECKAYRLMGVND